MKTIRFFGMVLMTILLSVGFAACSSDDDDNNSSSSNELVGRQICTSTTFTPDESGTDPDNYYVREDGYKKYGYGFSVGDGFKLFASGKCFILDGGYIELEDGEKVTDPTEAQWPDYEEEEVWSLEGGKLSIVEGDDDRWVGTYKISGNELTFTYKCQDWNGDSHTLTGEYPKTYVSVFKKQ